MSEKSREEAHASIGIPEISFDVSKRLFGLAITGLVKTKERASSLAGERREKLQGRIDTAKEAGSIVYDLGATALGTAIEKLIGKQEDEPSLGDHHQN